jgi:hypothetical protein
MSTQGDSAASVAADLLAVGAATSTALHEVTKTHTAMLQRQVVANASGRPGPNAPTGDYRRSINRQTTKTPTGSEGRVGTNKPQGRRLELGFAGEDSLGRSYDQPAYPHFGPALDEVAPLFEAAVGLIPDAVASSRRIGPAVGPNAPTTLADEVSL